MIHVNNDFGVNMVKEFGRAFAALGGTVVSVTPYNPSQASYQPEVTRALAGSPDALYLVSYPVDGATIARTWIAQGGVKKFLLNDGMNAAGFIGDMDAAMGHLVELVREGNEEGSAYWRFSACAAQAVAIVVSGGGGDRALPYAERAMRIAEELDHPDAISYAYYTDYSLVFAAMAIAVLPLVLVFLFFGRQIIGGIMEGAVKA